MLSWISIGETPRFGIKNKLSSHEHFKCNTGCIQVNKGLSGYIYFFIFVVLATLKYMVHVSNIPFQYWPFFSCNSWIQKWYIAFLPITYLLAVSDDYICYDRWNRWGNDASLKSASSHFEFGGAFWRPRPSLPGLPRGFRECGARGEGRRLVGSWPHVVHRVYHWENSIGRLVRSSLCWWWFEAWKR